MILFLNYVSLGEKDIYKKFFIITFEKDMEF